MTTIVIKTNCFDSEKKTEAEDDNMYYRLFIHHKCHYNAHVMIDGRGEPVFVLKMNDSYSYKFDLEHSSEIYVNGEKLDYKSFLEMRREHYENDE